MSATSNPQNVPQSGAPFGVVMKVRHESDVPAVVLRESEVPEVTGQVILRTLIEPTDGADIVLLIGEYSADSAIEMHGHDYEHEIYVLDGSLTIDIAGEAPGEVTNIPLKRGDAVFVPRGKIHGFSTGPNETARVLTAVPAEAMSDGPGHEHD